MRTRIRQYVRRWQRQGYPTDIPDAVPTELMRTNLAPSYRAICFAILRNDHAMTSLGFAPQPSPWYMALKRMEIAAREPQRRGDPRQLWLL